EPQGWNGDALARESLVQLGCLLCRLVGKAPCEGDRSIQHKRGAQRRPSRIKSLILRPPRESPLRLSFHFSMAARRSSGVAFLLPGTNFATGDPCRVIVTSSPCATRSRSSEKWVFAS